MDKAKLKNILIQPLRIEEFLDTVDNFTEFDAHKSRTQYFVDINGVYFKAILNDNGHKSVLNVLVVNKEFIEHEHLSTIETFEKMFKLAESLSDLEKGMLTSIIDADKEY